MNDEAGFLEHLSKAPEDATARLAYADWLAERDRGIEAERQRLMAPGYRALIGFGCSPQQNSRGRWEWALLWVTPVEFLRRWRGGSNLPVLWANGMQQDSGAVSEWPTAAEAMDAAAMGFGRLIDDVQEEFLSLIPEKGT